MRTHTPSRVDSKARRAPAHQRKAKVAKANDQDWKRDVQDLSGYAKSR